MKKVCFPNYMSSFPHFLYLISFFLKVLCKKVLVAQSCPTLCDTMDCTPQAPLSMEFSRQEYWSELPCPPTGDLPDLRIQPRSPALQAGSLPSEPPGKPKLYVTIKLKKKGKKLQYIKLQWLWSITERGTSFHFSVMMVLLMFVLFLVLMGKTSR